MKKIYNSTLIKLSTISPLFAKAILDSALEKIGKTAESITASEMLKLIKYEITPLLSKGGNSKQNLLLNAGAGQITINNQNKIIYMNDMAQKIYNDLKNNNGDENDAFDLFSQIGLCSKVENATEIMVCNTEFLGEHFTVTVTPIFDENKTIQFVNTVFQNTTLLNELENESLNQQEYLVKEIKQRLNAEKKLIENQEKMVSSSKLAALGEMGASIAHEINNPLGIIKMNNLLISKTLKKENIENDKIFSFIDSNNKNIDRITHIINSMRNLSRITDEMPFSKFTFQSVLDQTLPLCKQRFIDKKISLKLELSPQALEIGLKGRSIEIGQVLINLLNNATDAIENMEERWIKIQSVETEKYLIISVIDSGNGISQEIQDKIFQPFFSTKDIGKGTGLGVSVSAKILENHSGKLSVDNSFPNTKFDMKLPKSLP